MTAFFLSASVMLTVFAHVLLKYRSTIATTNMNTGGSYFDYMLRMALDPLVVLAVFAGFASMMAWIMAIRKIDLAYAYPFMALSFVLIPVFARIFLNEPLPLLQIVAGFIIVAGVALHAFAQH